MHSTTSMPACNPPGPRGWPWVGSLPAAAHDLLGFWTHVAARYGEVVLYRTGTERNYLISDPELIGCILQQDTLRYHKGRYTQLMKPVLGEGLPMSNGETWRQQRQLLQPAFAKQRVTRWLDIVSTATETMLDTWDCQADRGQSLDVAAEMTRLTQAIITKILFGRAVEHPLTASLLNAITILNSNLLPMMFREMLWGGLLNRLPLPSIRRGRRAATALHETVDSLIRNRRRDADALLTLLEGAYDENTQARLTDQQIHDQLTTFFLAGHETTACALAWTFYLLTEHPDWAERLQAEATRVIQSNSLTPEELDQLILTRQVIEEAMRLMPPVPSIGRRPDRDTEIGGWPIPAGSIVFMSPYVMHRHTRYWEVPERFDPDRFAPQRSQGRPRYAYFPFSGGPRTCIGAHLAMMEMLTIVALVVRHFRLGRVPGRRVVPQTLITLRPRFGVPVTISRR